MSMEGQLRKNISFNAIANLIITTIPIIIGFFLMPFIVHKLGNSAYGIWSLSLALLGFSGFLDLGLAPTVSKKTAEYLATGKKEEMITTSSTILALYTMMGFAVMVIFSLFAMSDFTSWFHIPLELEKTAKIALLILGVQGGIRFPLQLFHGIVQGMQKFVFRAIVILFITITRALLIVIFLSQGYGLIVLLVIDFFMQVIQGLIFILYVYTRLPSFTVNLTLVRWDNVKALFSFSLQVFILQISSLIILQSDKIIIGVFLPVAVITIYEIGLKIHDIIRSLVASIQVVVLPAASELTATKNLNALQELVIRGSKYVLILYFLIAIPAVVMARPFIYWWMGSEYAQSALIMQILIIGQFFNAINFVTGQVYVGMGILKVYTWVRIAGAVLNVCISIILLRIIGLPGVAMGTAIQFALSDIPLLLYFLSGLRITLKQYLNRCILPTLPCVAIAGGILVMYTMKLHFIVVGSVSWILLGGIIYVAVFIGLLFLVGLDYRERNEVFSLLKRTLRGAIESKWSR